MNPVEFVVVGAGQRGGRCFGRYAQENPNKFKVVAVAEPDEERRKTFADAHGIPADRQFRTWDDLYEKGQLAEAAVVTTQDTQHRDSVLPALKAGYDVLLEKPMAARFEHCREIAEAADRLSRRLIVWHGLRYTSIYGRIKEIIEDGRIGQVYSMTHRENVAYSHMAHSFVRGKWRNSDIESPMILQKTCHDMDLIYWAMGRARRLQSFGSLQFYRPENAPEGAPEYCLDGCPAEAECPFYAPRYYIPARGQIRQGMMSALTQDLTIEGVLKALDKGQYGRCVFRCDNNVVDNQMVNFEFENGATGALVLHGFSAQGNRTMRYDGTKGTLRAVFKGGTSEIEIEDSLTGTIERIEPHTPGGHGGGDEGVMDAFVNMMRGKADPPTTAKESLESHLMCFAAEQSRVKGTIEELDEWRR